MKEEEEKQRLAEEEEAKKKQQEEEKQNQQANGVDGVNAGVDANEAQVEGAVEERKAGDEEMKDDFAAAS